MRGLIEAYENDRIRAAFFTSTLGTIAKLVAFLGGIAVLVASGLEIARAF